MTKTISLVLMMLAAIAANGQTPNPTIGTGSGGNTNISFRFIQHVESPVLRAGYDAEGYWRVDYEDGNFIRSCALSWSIGDGKEICLTQWRMTESRNLPSSTRALDRRPPMRRDAGHSVIPDRTDPISVINGSGGYPEIAPGSYVIVSAPINRIGNGWAQVTELDGVSVSIGGQPSMIFELWKDGVSVIASNDLSVGGTHDVVVTTPEGRYHGKVRVLNVAPGISKGFRDGSFQSWPVGLYRVGSGFPAPISDEPIPPTRGSSRTVVKVLAAGFRRAQTVQVFVEDQRVPLIVVAPFLLPGQEEIAFELPEWLRGDDRLVKVTIFADGAQANPFWLRLPATQQ